MHWPLPPRVSKIHAVPSWGRFQHGVHNTQSLAKLERRQNCSEIQLAIHCTDYLKCGTSHDPAYTWTIYICWPSVSKTWQSRTRMKDFKQDHDIYIYIANIEPLQGYSSAHNSDNANAKLQSCLHVSAFANLLCLKGCGMVNRWTRDWNLQRYLQNSLACQANQNPHGVNLEQTPNGNVEF